MQEKLLDLNASLLEGLKWIFVTLIKYEFPSFSLPFFDHHLHHFHSPLSFFHFLPLIFNLLFLITSSSDVWFLIRLFLWLTHSTDFRETALDNQILHFLLHIFHRIMWDSMRENWYFPWLICTFIGALKPVMRSVFLFFCFILQFSVSHLGLIYLHAIKFK